MPSGSGVAPGCLLRGGEIPRCCASPEKAVVANFSLWGRGIIINVHD